MSASCHVRETSNNETFRFPLKKREPEGIAEMRMMTKTALKDWLLGPDDRSSGELGWRHEWKFPISIEELLSIRESLRRVARPDANAENTDGCYRIRSLYFDDLDDHALYEKIEGVNYREKFRIRFYNRNTAFIRLEKKAKQNGLGQKESAELKAQEVENLLKYDLGWMADEQMRLFQVGRDESDIFSGEKPRALVVELFRKMCQNGLRPKNIVEYMREPYTFSPGNVRVTFDYDLRYSPAWQDFLNPGCMLAPAEGSPLLMEVKWDRFLPDVIQRAVSVYGITPSAFSKYAQCRVFDW